MISYQETDDNSYSRIYHLFSFSFIPQHPYKDFFSLNKFLILLYILYFFCFIHLSTYCMWSVLKL